MRAFTPNYQSTISIDVTATSSNTDIPGISQSLLLSNVGENVCYVNLTTVDDAVGTVAGMPVLANSQIVITRGALQDRLIAICAATESTTLKVTPGDGL